MFPSGCVPSSVWFGEAGRLSVSMRVCSFVCFGKVMDMLVPGALMVVFLAVIQSYPVRMYW